MKAMKFGGAVLGSPEGFRCMVDILKKETVPCLVVISAFSTATRDLEFAARLARKGLTAEAVEQLDNILDDHRVLIRRVLPDQAGRSTLDALLSEVRGAILNLLRGIAITQQLTKRTLDQVLAFGELLALHITRQVLQYHAIDVGAIDAHKVVVTTDDFGHSLPLFEKTKIHVDLYLRPLLDSHQIVLIQGFVGATEDGTVTTMGKESSNLTATLLGSMLKVSEITIWTNVEGVRSGDPEFCNHTRVRQLLSYDEASLAAKHGVKILYPTMIAPARESEIPIIIRSASNPSGEFTSIGTQSEHSKPIVAIQEIDDVHSNVNVVFTSLPTWIRVMAEATSLIDNNIISISGSELDGVCSATCPHNVAESIASTVHDLMLKEYHNSTH